jgi:hypothetical protein
MSSDHPTPLSGLGQLWDIDSPPALLPTEPVQALAFCFILIFSPPPAFFLRIQDSVIL